MEQDTSLEFPFAYANVESLGRLFYPIVQLKLKTIFGWKEFDFLVDTGADLTTLPFTAASFLGINLSRLKQSKTLGVGGIFVPTFDITIPIKIGSFQLKIRASITKDKSTPFLLGRKDILEEEFSLLLDSQNKLTILKKNNPS